MRLSCIVYLSFFFFSVAFSQVSKSTQSNEALTSYLSYQSRQLGQLDSLPINQAIAPFYHGVASGDPLPDRVVIWTRITTEATGPVSVDWEVARDTSFNQVVASGQFVTGPQRDYTVKVDVSALSAGNTYYYRFLYADQSSIIGRTKTAPIDEVSQLKFAVVSCSNYPQGYFNAYGRVAERNDLDAVIHLGDYIYEYPNGVFGRPLEGDREVFPANETITLMDYRIRYSLYHLDPQLMRAHQQHPFLCVWDDHESADNSYKDGANNHQPDTEGEWVKRKQAAKKAYFEWLPIRDNDDTTIFRTIHYGNLADIILLDTRLEGREQQLEDINDPLFNDPNRTILGEFQRNWFLNELSQSTAQWKVVGTQVLFSPFNVGFIDNNDPDSVESLFLDIWDGYPAERDSIISFIDGQEIDDVVFIAGDVHISFAMDITANPTDTASYEASSGRGSIAVEFVTPSITTPNFNEFVGDFLTSILQSCINQACLTPFGTTSPPNPHIKFADLGAHGYFILDLKADSSQANWYFVDDLLTPNEQERFASAWYTMSGENHLNSSAQASAPKLTQDIPAPAIPQMLTSISPDQFEQDLVLISTYPNPTQDFLFLQYSLQQYTDIHIELYTLSGKSAHSVIEQSQQAGIYNMAIDMRTLSSGTYFLRLKTKHSMKQLQVMKY